MKQSTIIVAAFLSYLASASPQAGSCTPVTVTVTVGGGQAAAAPSATSQAVSIGGNNAEGASQVTSDATNLASTAVQSAVPDTQSQAPDAAVPSSGAISSNTDTGINPSVSASPVVGVSSAIAESSASVAGAAAPISILMTSASGISNTAPSSVANDSADSAASLATFMSSATSISGAAPSASTGSSSSESEATIDSTNDASSAQIEPNPGTVTQVLTSTIKGAASIIKVTNVATQYTSDPSPAPPSFTTVTKVFMSIINGGASTLTISKTEVHTLHHSHHAKTGSPSSPTHHVTVGKGGKMAYEPSHVKAVVGDTIRFRFFPTNHTVTSNDFDTPCKKNGHFDSGFKPTYISNSTIFVDYSVKEANKPLWFHSRQKGECKQGMVFAINPRNKGQFDQFVAKAKGSTSNQTDANPQPNGAIVSTNATSLNVTRRATPIRLLGRIGSMGGS